MNDMNRIVCEGCGELHRLSDKFIYFNEGDNFPCVKCEKLFYFKIDKERVMKEYTKEYWKDEEEWLKG